MGKCESGPGVERFLENGRKKALWNKIFLFVRKYGIILNK